MLHVHFTQLWHPLPTSLGGGVLAERVVEVVVVVAMVELSMVVPWQCAWYSLLVTKCVCDVAGLAKL